LSPSFWIKLYYYLSYIIAHLVEGIMADLWRDFWIRETGTGQQVAQLRDKYIIIIIIIIVIIIILGISFMQGFYTYIPETNRVPSENCVPTILM
jgi:hypothetical protein